MAPDAGRRPAARTVAALLTLLGVANVTLPRRAHALSVDKAVVKFNPKKGDGFVLKGSLGGIAADGVETISLAFGSFVENLPRASFASKGQKLVYKAPNARGVRTLVIDGAKRRFLVVGKGIVLVPAHNPAAVRLSADAASECAMIRFTEATRQWRLAGPAGDGACALEVPPEVVPSGFLVGRETDVRIVATLTPGVALDGGSLTLVRVDPNLVPSGGAVCTLLDDGLASSGDDAAGDGFYGCIARFNEPAPVRIRLLVQATVGGAPTSSPSATLDVATALTDEEIAAGIAAQEMAGAAWDENLVALGDTAKARKATVARIKKIPGVSAAGITPDGFSIWIRYDSGVEGGLNLDPPGTPGSGGEPEAVPAALSVPPSASRAIRPALPTAAPRIGNAKVLVWDPWASETALEPTVLDRLRLSTCPTFDVTYLKNDECTVESIRTFPSYGTVIILTHGAVLLDRVVAFMTREQATFFSQWSTHRDDLKLGRLLVYKGQRSPEKHGYLVVRPSFIANIPGRFPDSVVFAGACLSAANRTLADVFFAKGVKAYVGMSQVVYARFSKFTADDLFDRMIKDKLSVFQAREALTHKTDASLLRATGSNLKPLNSEVTLIQGDGRLAYACAPTSGEVLLDALSVAVNGEQTGTAVLRSDVSYRLLVTGTATETLDQGTNQFDAFYCFGGFCSVGPFGDSRLIGVSIVVEGGEPSPHVALSEAVEGDYPSFQASHTYEVTYRPPLDGRIRLTSPHVASQGPFATSGSFTIQVYGPP